MSAYTVLDVEQRSPEWFAARRGRLTGSQAKAMLATIRSGEAAARRDLRTKLVLERITEADMEADGFVSPWMQRGMDLEAEALLAFEAYTGELVRQTGFIAHDDVLVGCSLDGDIGDFGAIVESKSPKPATHLGYLRNPESLVVEYSAQLRHNVWVVGAERAFAVSYCPEFPEPLRLVVVEREWDDLDIPEYEEAALAFLAEVDAEVEEVLAMAAPAGAAA